MDGTQPLSFGDLLKRYRLAAGLTQEALAERSQMSVRTIGNVERGVPHTPRQDSVRLLAAALNLSPQQYTAFVAAARAQRLSCDLPLMAERAEDRASSSVPPLPPDHRRSFRLQLVGRAREMARLHCHLSAPPGEGPPLLVLAGEPGIGKTRLLRETIVRAAAEGWSVLEGSGHRRGGPEPYAPLLEALERHVRTQPPVALRTSLEGCGWVVRLLPELAEQAVVVLRQTALPPEQERRLLFQAVRRYLANAAGPAGTLLVLDDLQWAGSEALDLLAALVRPAANAPPLRVVGAYRSTEVRVEEPLGVLLEELERAELAERLALGPLAAKEARMLLDELLTTEAHVMSTEDTREEWAGEVLRRAGGIPLFLVSCAQALRDGASMEGAIAAQNGSRVPQDVVHSIQQRVAILPETAQELLGMVAVAGRHASRRRLLVMAGQSGWTEREVIVALEAACRARLLVEVGKDAYACTNDLIREAIVAGLSTARRAALHRQVMGAREQEKGMADALIRSRNAVSAVRGQAMPPTERRNRVGRPATRAEESGLEMLR